MSERRDEGDEGETKDRGGSAHADGGSGDQAMRSCQTFTAPLVIIIRRSARSGDDMTSGAVMIER